ncbi:glycosidase [Candidatus Kuenenbacteria bacterium CG08_land_8_20_14_0_20_37_23]|uniref:Glycosidase n=1 Tax=Candidatus Kuenenbacteria bacterium CG08_land_8_20_14_0_20_37_23 TaxID=1974617 RepID=A0A2M6XT87_9BACT|nr:MAG: glycosidase [Parcubacteria group bacterium CG23_combo_of_CG06-09_8_20_14_all_35_9]PIU10852.1 MAG: glycosidase [Candidatus Kuenenbacteria bacterium CG08_land_8_20_14_0_20_37_23]
MSSNQLKLKRCSTNPILKPNSKNSWERKAVFNPAAIEKDGKIYLLYRAIGEHKKYVSRIGLAVSKDGIHFHRVSNKPVLKPEKKYEQGGTEDPRIIKIGSKFYITYVALTNPFGKSPRFARTFLFSTSNFRTFKRIGLITSKRIDNKDVVLFPEKINGAYVMLHRPRGWTRKNVFKKNGKLYFKGERGLEEWSEKQIPKYFPEKPGIWIAYGKDFKNFAGHKLIMEQIQEWENDKIGTGPPPIKTKYGWLLIYHGVEEVGVNPKYISWAKKPNTKIYRAGAALLDLYNPSKIIARLPYPILEPEKDYEIYGDTCNVVFPEGALIKDGQLFVYYGAADKVIGLAIIKLEKLLSAFLKHKWG